MNGAAPRRALVIEDDDSVAGYLGSTLEMEGWTVSRAVDGTVGIDELLSSPPDLVVVDMMMPGASGLEVLQAMHAHPKLSALPAVVCTARDSALEREAAATFGVSEWLQKPVSPDDLLAAVARVTA